VAAGGTANPILVVGVGNPLHPRDSCGVKAAELLSRRGLEAEVRVLGLGVSSLLHLARGRRAVIILDAAPSGDVVEVEGGGGCGTSHGAGVLHVARLVRGLYGVRVYIVNCALLGVEGAAERAAALVGALRGGSTSYI